MKKFVSACVPGGTTFTAPFLPRMMNLSLKTPPGVFFLIRAIFTGPLAPAGSAYLRPIVVIGDQPLAGISKHCEVAGELHLECGTVCPRVAIHEIAVGAAY